MMLDARTVSDGAVLDYEVCIVGAGAAGITLALELAGHDARVCLLEAGGLKADPETQRLYRGVNAGREYYELDECRLRLFGGTTNHWAGFCLPISPNVFEPRPWVTNGYGGWPFGREELNPYYERAHGYCQLGRFDYDPGYWTRKAGFDAAPVDSGEGDFRTIVTQHSPPTRFGTVYRDAVTETENVDVVLWGNAAEFTTDRSGNVVSSVSVRTLEGNAFSVTADRFVLAAGALENARLLLMSDSDHGRGLGNAHDLVGRFFTEHLIVRGGYFLPSDPALSYDFYDWVGWYDRDVLGSWEASSSLLEENELLNGRIRLRGWYDVREYEPHFLGSDSFKALYRGAREGEWPGAFAEHLWNVVTELDQVGPHLWKRLRGNEPRVFQLVSEGEQSPTPDSRVTLTSERDTLGLPKLRLRWRVRDRDLRSLERHLDLFAHYVGQQGMGRVRLPEADAYWSQELEGAFHHMGTTRMSTDPRTGVVDEDCRVHATENLYVAGSSVFPVSGHANPTLTIVALAIRLADHLKEAA